MGKTNKQRNRKMALEPIFDNPDLYIPQLIECLRKKAPFTVHCNGTEQGINPESPCRLYDPSVRPDTNGYPRIYIKGDTVNGYPSLQVKLHHAVMLISRWRQYCDNSFGWKTDTGQGGLVLAHSCHQKYCMRPSHMVLVPKGVNTDQSAQNCFDYMICNMCKTKMSYPCSHEKEYVRCKAVIHTTCSDCSFLCLPCKK